MWASRVKDGVVSSLVLLVLLVSVAPLLPPPPLSLSLAHPSPISQSRCDFIPPPRPLLVPSQSRCLSRL